MPNHVFAAAGQGQNEAWLKRPRYALLSLRRYNYASGGGPKESLSLYTLGHIFEQSITELEYREGELEGRETVAKLSKRKRDGVYYTPEASGELSRRADARSVVRGRQGGLRLSRLRRGRFRGPQLGGLRSTSERNSYRRPRLRLGCLPDFGISPAFGGAARGRPATWKGRAVATSRRLSTRAPLIAEILRSNIYGVDINPASVEIAKLALWLHSARASAPLSSLEHTIRIGNSLVGEDFWAGRRKTAQARRACQNLRLARRLSRGLARRAGTAASISCSAIRLM